MTNTSKRLIEVAFPLKQTSIDSVHEKNVRHGHISTLHIWPARRPLAACRAALIATLLPDPGDPEERKLLIEKLGGKVVQKVKRKRGADGRIEEEIVEETEGGILHWGRENSPDIEWFRQKIREAYGGSVPKMLDPFAGGGAIPLEAMRLGCEATAVDINPVAWFILKCTLEYPQKLAGQTHPLPEFAIQDQEFMRDFFKAQGFKGQALITKLAEIGHQKTEKDHQLSYLPSPDNGRAVGGEGVQADLAWHVRAWGRWVLIKARRDLARFYPTYADFEPLADLAGTWEKRPMQLVPLNDAGEPDIAALNAEFDEEYLHNLRNPRWVKKTTVAYLWARTVKCKNCRAEIPLLKTRWLCKKDRKRILLTMQPNLENNGVVFKVQENIPPDGATPAHLRAHDKKIGAGTMSRSGATCPYCKSIMSMEDIQLEGKAGRIRAIMTSVVMEGVRRKEYRLPFEEEIHSAEMAEKEYELVFSKIPYGLPEEALPSKEALGFRAPLYGYDQWKKLFNSRQLLGLGIFIKYINEGHDLIKKYYKDGFSEAVLSYLACTLNKAAGYNSTICFWHISRELISHTYTRFALPMTWDFVEIPLSNSIGGGFEAQLEWIARYIEHALKSLNNSLTPHIENKSAIGIFGSEYDNIITDPPYYDAIPYSDLMDFFYIWLKRTLFGVSPEFLRQFDPISSPKWDHSKNDGELIDDSSRHNGDSDRSRRAYETGMSQAFSTCNKLLTPDGRMVVVFANKKPDAWETLVNGIIQAGFVVTGSWPIQTEMATRIRAKTSAALASSVWIVCKKRPETNRPGWDNRVIEEMHANIRNRLYGFWDAGIRGPDFVWAATGPALEVYSQYPAVKKANEPNQLMTVSEFLSHVRRIVVDFVVGRVLSEAGEEAITGLDAITTYYLLHRHDFGMSDAPAGPCIMYAVSCGLADKDLADRYDILSRKGKSEVEIDEEEIEESDEAGEESDSGGSVFRLKAWNQRKRPNMGYDPHLDRQPTTLPKLPGFDEDSGPTIEIPLIDQIHRIMQLWRGGDVSKVDEYLDLRGLRHSQLFHPLLQALIELAAEGSEERSILESISNHVGAKGQTIQRLF